MNLAPAAEILGIVQRVISDGQRDLQRAQIKAGDMVAVSTCDPLGFRHVELFEAELRKLTAADYAIAVSSGTAALHLALMAVGVRLGDEVIVPTLTFAATAFAVKHCGAIPHFVDVSQRLLGINSFKLRQYLAFMPEEQRTRIKAIVPVHLLGMPCDIDGVMDIASRYGIAVVEDAAEALGTGLLGVNAQVGLSSRAGIFSFNCNKIVTTGGGGAIVTQDASLAHRVRHLAYNAKIPHDWLWEHDEVGWNYRMPNMCAALGLGQLTRFFDTLYAKRQLTSRYAAAFFDSGVAQLISDNRSNCWLNAITLMPHYAGARDDVIRTLRDAGYSARAIFTPLHMLAMFADCPRQQNLMVAEDLFKRMVCLPSSLGN